MKNKILREILFVLFKNKLIKNLLISKKVTLQYKNLD